MQLHIHIDRDILKEFSDQLGAQIVENKFIIPEKWGVGTAEKISFDGDIELISMQFALHQPIQTQSKNPDNSPYFLLNINLSEKSVDKTVNGAYIEIQRNQPSGMLFYKPGTSVSSISPVGVPFTILLVRFPKMMIQRYLEEKEEFSHISHVISSSSLIYEDLDLDSENYLRKILSSTNRFQKHAHLLSFLGIFIKKLGKRSPLKNSENINSEDLKTLFMVAGKLRDPFMSNMSTNEDLAKLSAMSLTKFKNVFKQVFGTSPYQYHLQAKMQYAYRELIQGSQTISEVSYQLGYSHPSKFTIAFKKQFHMLPSEIRA
ncbi:helix-turn-helix domain-containing protein [Aquimarina sp. 2304DJ70-9]|uniref:helix-turn-helix domain-containing protein n=1 Tax=Aquimarina penaris TaxID=3231044 RepID=UPI0034619A39